MRIRAKEIHRTRKRAEERLREKIKSLRNVKPVTTSRTTVRGGTRPTAGKTPSAPRPPRPPRPAEGRGNE